MFCVVASSWEKLASEARSSVVVKARIWSVRLIDPKNTNFQGVGGEVVGVSLAR